MVINLKIKEYIQFGEFDSKALNLYLISRDAPAPYEKEKVVDNPFRNGVTDFSVLYGEKKFSNRPITYVFQAFKKIYRDRKILERLIKSKLVTQMTTDLYDTHDPGYHWVGKVSSISIVDDEAFDTLTATVVFSCYPYLYRNFNYYDDYVQHHTVDDTLSWTKFNVEGSKEIAVFNQGETTLDVDILVWSTQPTIETEGGTNTQEIKIVTIPAVTYVVKSGDTLYRIALNNGTTVNDLKKWNNLTGDWVFPGNVLIVKPEETQSEFVQTQGAPTIVREYFMRLTDEDGVVHYLSAGMNYNQDIQLNVGVNRFKVEGIGQIALHSRAEVMG